MKALIACGLALALTACASWSPRTPEQIKADQGADARAERAIQHIRRDFGSDGLTTGSGF